MENFQLHSQNNFHYVKFNADDITPVSALLKLRDVSDTHVLFESVIGGERRGRYSVIALDPYETFTFTKDSKTEPFNELRKFIQNTSKTNAFAQDLPPMAEGIFGYMNYDMVKFMEDLPTTNEDKINIPLSQYFAPKITIIFDNSYDSAYLILRGINEAEANSLVKEVFERLNANTPETKAISVGEFEAEIEKAEYKQIVENAKEYIKAGDIFQIVPSRRKRAKFTGDGFNFYRNLRRLNPSPYMFYCKFGDAEIIGSSPEIMVRVEDGKATIRPIAGTRKRGANETEDKALEAELLADIKERAEHLMLLDLGRNDLGRVANNVEVTESFIIERYSHVMHIVSNVEGELAENKDAIDALIAGFPAGTTSGAPKIRAMEIIEELEQVQRSFYAGTVGYFAGNGNMDTCINLRTALIKDGYIYAQAGGGIVYDSDPESEYYETENKMMSIIKACE